jgi:hypothetical protein
MAKAKKAVSECIIDPITGEVTVTLGDDGENWMAEHRLELLRARGWLGTLREYIDTWERLDGDPLEHTPPITSGRG